MEATPIPYLASVAYFQSSSTPCTTPILRPEPPTPRKMLSKAPVSSPMVNRRRRYSSIPRPASGSSRRATSSTQQLPAPGEGSSIISVPPSSCITNRSSQQRLDTLQSCSVVESQHQDLSGVRQQLHVRKFSTQSIQSLEAISSPHNTVVRSLMRPLGPPLPRSHTTGNIVVYSQPPSPARQEPKAEHSSPCRLDASPEIDVVDALYESRMTREEVELLNQIEKEKKQNKARLLRITGTARMASSPGHIAQVQPKVDTKTSSWLSLEPAASRAMIRDHVRRKMTDSDDKGILRVDPALANASRSPRASLLTPKSALSIVTSPDETNPRLVYLAEPTTYWTGRFIALCDKSRTYDVARIISFVERQTASDDEHDDAQHEPFETVERRRMRSVLEDLRYCCQSEIALKSFENFADSLMKMRLGPPADGNKPATLIMSTAGATGVPITTSRLRHPWLFGSISNATNAASRITSVTNTISSNKAPATADKAGSLVKSKTTGNLTETGYRVAENEAFVRGSAILSSGKIQHTRQPSNLSIQAQMNARALREREERATRRAEETKRRVNSRSVFDTSMTAPPFIRKSKKAQDQTSAENPEPLYRQVKLSPRGPGRPELRGQPQSQRPSVIQTISMSGLEKRSVDRSKNRDTSISSSISPILDEEEARAVERHVSAPRELWRRTNRQGSGDMLKNMVTGGLKGVRRMGRSLTGRSEFEELGQPLPQVVNGSDSDEKRWVSRGDEVEAAV